MENTIDDEMKAGLLQGLTGINANIGVLASFLNYGTGCLI